MENQNIESQQLTNFPVHDYNLDPVAERVSCSEHIGSCYPIKLLTASPSKFHDQTLMEATAKINEALASIPPDNEGRTVSLLASKVGIMLAWVHYENPPEGGCVSAQTDRETMAKALKLVV